MGRRFDARDWRQMMGGRPRDRRDTEERCNGHEKNSEHSQKLYEQPSINHQSEGGTAMSVKEVRNVDTGEEANIDPNGPVIEAHTSNGEQLAYSHKSERRRSLPNVTEYWVPVRLSDLQLEQYCATLVKNKLALSTPFKRERLDDLHNTILAIRECCDHPYLVDENLQFAAKSDNILETGIKASGKLHLLAKFLLGTKKQGKRVLILYQSLGRQGKHKITTGHILDDFVRQSFGEDSYVHIYGREMQRSMKQEALNRFNDINRDMFVILVENDASQQSIKVSSLDIVILFNSQFDPWLDTKFLQKVTHHPRLSHLLIFRLYSSCTLEEKILVKAKEGTKIDHKINYLSHIVSHNLIIWGATYLFDRLDALHGSLASNSAPSISGEQALLDDVLEEMKQIVSSRGENGRVNSSIVLRAQECYAGYTRNITLFGESRVEVIDGVPANVFWDSLLKERDPQWKLLPKQPSVRRRCPLTYNELNKVHVSENDREPIANKCITKCNTGYEKVGQKRVATMEKPLARKKSRKLTGIFQTASVQGVRHSSSSKQIGEPLDCLVTPDVAEDMSRSDCHGAVEACSITFKDPIGRRMREIISKQQREIKDFFRTKRKEQGKFVDEHQLAVDRIHRECNAKEARKDAMNKLDRTYNENLDKFKCQAELRKTVLEDAQLAQREKCSESRMGVHVKDPQDECSILTPMSKCQQPNKIRDKLADCIPCNTVKTSPNFPTPAINTIPAKSDGQQLLKPTYSASSPQVMHVVSAKPADAHCHSVEAENDTSCDTEVLGSESDTSLNTEVLQSDVSTDPASPVSQSNGDAYAGDTSLKQPTGTLSSVCPNIQQTCDPTSPNPSNGLGESGMQDHGFSQPALGNSAVPSGQCCMELEEPLPLSDEDMRIIESQYCYYGLDILPDFSIRNYVGNFGSIPDIAWPDGCTLLEREMNRIREEKKKEEEIYDDEKIHLKYAQIKELEEMERKYSAILQDMKDEHEKKKAERNIQYEIVRVSKQLAAAVYCLMPEA